MRSFIPREAETLRKAAHGFKSSSANVGAMELAALCKELEISGRNSTLDNIDAVFKRLEQEYQQVEKALIQECETYAS